MMFVCTQEQLLQRNMALRSSRNARCRLAAASQQYGFAIKSKKLCVLLGGGRNHSTITANDSLSGPAYECRAGRSSEGVCQGKQWHGLDYPYLYLSTDKHVVNPSVQFFPMFANGFHNQSLRIGRRHGKDEV